MMMHGVMSGSNPETTVVEDHEKMREFEERLAREKEEIRMKADSEREAI